MIRPTAAVLAKIPLFRRVGPEDRERLGALGQLRTYERGVAPARRADNAPRIGLPLSRQELADLTGTTIETAIRIMSRWGKDDVLRTERDGFVLTDRKTLEELAGS